MAVMPATTNRRVLVSCLLLCTTFLPGRLLAQKSGKSPSTQPAESSDTGNWRKVKSSEGVATAKVVAIKFQPTTRTWRVTIDSSIKGEPTVSKIRVAVMVETYRDDRDKPVNWSQVDLLHDGKPGGKTIERTFDNGLDKNDELKWFQLIITGQNARYEVLIEDQGEGKSKKKKKSD
jgi:hypothetical protein